MRYKLSNAVLRESYEALLGDMDPFDLLEELALMRLTVHDAVSLYETSKQAGEQEQIILAGQYLRRVCGEVAKFVEKAQSARLASANTALSQTQTLGLMQEAIRERFGNDPRATALLQELPRLVRAEQESRGTAITPDMEVEAMDATIPGPGYQDARLEA